jgi:tetratricopeptide (TPR) repeat protein
MLGGTLFVLGEHGRCLALWGEAEALARALDDRVRLGRVLASMAQLLRTVRDYDGAIAAGQQAHGCLGHLYLAQGDLEHAIRVLEQGLALCRASGDRDLLRPILAGLGYASALQGHLAEGRALLKEAIKEHISTGALQNRSRWAAWLSEVCHLAGRGEEAWQHARQALDLARQRKERGNEALALHQLGAAHAHADPPEAAQAEVHYQQALALADELGMRPLVAHCQHGLGNLYATIGRHAEARAALSAAIELYRAMAMTFWLPQAEAALVQVEGQ